MVCCWNRFDWLPQVSFAENNVFLGLDLDWLYEDVTRDQFFPALLFLPFILVSLSLPYSGWGKTLYVECAVHAPSIGSHGSRNILSSPIASIVMTRFSLFERCGCGQIHFSLDLVFHPVIVLLIPTNGCKKHPPSPLLFSPYRMDGWTAPST